MKKFFAVRFSKTHGNGLCLPCVLWRRTTKFQKNMIFLASFYLCTTNTLLCNIYFNLVLISIFLLFFKNLFHWKYFFRLSQIWTTSA
jgi:hypothetical protein